MHNIRQLCENVFWVGAEDRRLALFENTFPITNGVSYNSYLIRDEKTVLLDTVDKAVSAAFFENLDYALGGRKLDYAVVSHMEPDHCATLGELVLRYPEVKIIGNAQTFRMMKQFFGFDVDSRAVTVKEGDVLETGTRTLSFIMAPMVHWPEVMVAYDSKDKILFSADAFGTFGALNGTVFADEGNFERTYLDEARRYYANIVGKYGAQVQALLKKAAALDIEMLCPLHGPVWRESIEYFIEKYMLWSSYAPEDKAVMIACASIYGNTENAASILASRLAELGVKSTRVYDLSSTPVSVIVAEAFRCSNLVFAASTYNAGIFTPMENALRDLAAHSLRSRSYSLIQNGSWAPSSGKLMAEILGGMQDMVQIGSTVTIKSSVKESELSALFALAEEIAASLKSGN